MREVQGPGTYRLEQTGDDRLFAWAHGPDAAKRYLFPPRETIQTAHRDADGAITVTPAALADARYAFVGLRSCDLHAIEVQDRVFLKADPAYRARREQALFIGVNCGHPGATCFCVSMDTGPRCSSGFDIALTELEAGFTAEAGTPHGAELLDALSAASATDAQSAESLQVTETAAGQMGRMLETHDLPGLLHRNPEHPRWDDVAARCLNCTNCTMACPTCFCHDITDGISLDGAEATREREWASCFSEEYSHTGVRRGALQRALSLPPVAHPQVRLLARAVRHERLRRMWALHHVVPGGDRRDRGDRRDPHERRRGACERRGPRMSAVLARTGEPIAGVPTLTATVQRVVKSAERTVTYWSVFDDAEARRAYAFEPGQISMVGVFGVGEVPISISSDPARPTHLAHTIRACGRVTNVIGQLKAGDRITLRGPLGRPWPVERSRGGDLVIVAGGVGLAPLRSAVYSALRHRGMYRRVLLLVGARDPDQMLFRRQLETWLGWSRYQDQLEVHLTVDEANASWPHREGLVTSLFPHVGIDPQATTVFTCGPEVVMRFALRDLSAMGIPDERLWLTMERTMHCAVRLCGHCQFGPFFVCADGPIFRWDEVRDMLEVPEL